MTGSPRFGTALLFGLGLLLVAGAFFVSPGFYIIDEVVYVFGADTFRSTGSFFLDNGYEEFRSRDLRWIDLLVNRTEGLTAQYPVGSAVIGAGLIAMLDVRGILLFHAVCMAASVFVVRALAIKLFQDERIGLATALLFLLGTFVSEYAYGYWPHAVSVLTITAGFLWFLHALEAEDRAFRFAATSGLILGVGLLFRLDSLFLLPVIGLLTVPLARRPIAVFLGGALGLIPSLVLLSFANQIKFGTPNPISYGQAGGAVGLSGYIVFAAGAAVLFIALIAVRAMQLRVKPRLVAVAAVTTLAVAAVFVPEVQRLVTRLYSGFVALFVDAKTIDDPRGGVQRAADGTLRFWGLPKKALGQSLPWLGILLVLVFAPWGRHRRSISIVLVFAAVWSFPFVMRSWHGGLGLNMRYMMPLLPVLCALAVVLIWQLAEQVTRGLPLMLGAAALGLIGGIIWTLFMPSGISGAHQFLSTYVLFAVAVTALIAGMPRLSTGPVAALSLGTTSIGLGLALFLSVSDLWISQLRRLEVLTDTTQGYDGPAIVYLHPFRSALIAPDQLFAVPHWKNGGPDAKLVRNGLDKGMRVLMPLEMAEKFVATNPEFQLGAQLSEPLLMRDILKN